MNEQSLGLPAGIVWSFLQECGPGGTSLSSVKKIPGLRPDETLAAIGWLAREGKLEFERVRQSVRVTLSRFEIEPLSAKT